MSQDNFSLNQVTTKQMLGLIIIAYIFSFAIRMIWVWQFKDNSAFFWNDQLMINTNDGYFFASGAQESLSGLHLDNPRVPSIWIYGVVFFTTLFVKITPFSLETIILYMPAMIASLVVIPIILIARLYKETLWGFFAALLGSIAWSYYNRTMIGYYDTDMFSAMAPMFILFFLIKSTMDFNLKSALYAAIAIAIYPFLYDQGRAVIYAMGIIYSVYMIFYHRNENTTYLSLILIFVALIPFSLAAPMTYIIKIIVLLGLYVVLKKSTLEQKKMMLISGILFILFIIFGNVFGLILAKVTGYLSTGTKEEGLHFYSVIQTVREAGKIPFSTFANRISGSQIGVLLSLLGYIILVVRHRAFILALPLVGIGIFALLGGLRFTVYAVPIAAMSVIYLFFILGNLFKEKKLKYAFIVCSTAVMLYPNITHIIGYKVPTVFNKSEVNVLNKLKEISNSKDYTLAWWDYGYPIWYYSNTSTLIDGGKHSNDNFIISQILNTTSQTQAANLSRLAVETYVSSEYKIVADEIFNNKQDNQINPNILLDELKNKDYKLPEKTRDVFLFLPYKMLNILPTVSLFSNLDLTTGEKKKRPFFFLSRNYKESKDGINLGSGVYFDHKNGKIQIGKKLININNFVVTAYDKQGVLKIQAQRLDRNSSLNVIYMKNYNTFLVLDNNVYNSTYIQMFVLENFDKSLFEAVILTPHTKVYKLKI